MEELKKRVLNLLESTNYFLYDLDYGEENGEHVLRVLIENDSKITLDDCVIVSQMIGEMLDDEDPFSEAYQLEVASAGAERVLYTKEQILRHIGKIVHVETFDQQLTGKLIQYKNGVLVIQGKNNKETKIDEMDIQLIRLSIGY
jgi:ribosome maturation factor RimP